MDMKKLDKVNEKVEFYKGKLYEAEAELKKVFHEVSEGTKKVKILDQTFGEDWVAYQGDCVEVLKGVPNDSVHYTIFSPPFSSLFTYSASIRDMGNSSDVQFYNHFGYVVSEMFRVTAPGRLLSFHCSDIPAMKERDGYIGLKDFPGLCLRLFEGAGFIYHSKVLIKKNALIEATRTKALGLAHKQVVKDSAMCRNALPDYIVTVRKPGVNLKPISRSEGFTVYSGTAEQPTRPKHSNPALNRFSQQIWQRYADSVWSDIRQGDTLNVKLAREKNDERHLCPLQLPVIERCLELWSTKGDIVASWFAGIGSEGYVALKMGRRFVGVELKKSYYDVMVKNLNQISRRGNKKINKFF